MPRSPLAPLADGPTSPARRRAVIAATAGAIASTIGLVLLGIGSAAASIGPSPGPAAGPLPKPVAIPATSAPDSIAEVLLGLPPIPVAADPVLVAQAPPTLSPPRDDDPSTTPSGLPRTGRDSTPVLMAAAVAAATGIGLVLLGRARRPSPRAARVPARRRPGR